MTTQPKPLILRTMAFLMIGAAIWFIGLQLVVIKEFCPWCCATHLVGLLTAFFILKSVSITPVQVPAGLAICGMLALALGQAFGPEPETSLMTDSEFEPEQTSEKTAPTTVTQRLIDLGGGKTIVFDEAPFIGPADAPHVLVKYFDYTCGSCREMEGDLDALRLAHPGKVAVVLQPTPINRACNPNVPLNFKDHDHACELARLGIASWIANRDSFPEVHELLFSRPILTAERAKEEVEEIMGAEELAAALNSPEIKRQIQKNTSDYGVLSRKTGKMPKLAFGKGKILHGLSKNTESFVKTCEEVLKID